MLYNETTCLGPFSEEQGLNSSVIFSPEVYQFAVLSLSKKTFVNSDPHPTSHSPNVFKGGRGK